MTTPALLAMLATMGYPGGKNGSGVYQTIINTMPPHSTYVEPFLGGGAILRRKRPAAVNIGVDRDPEVIRLWRSHLAAQSESGRRRSPNLAMEYSSGPRAISSDASSAISNDGSSFQFLEDNALTFLARRRFSPETLIYCDPPYMHETRGRPNLYNFEMTDVDHRRFLRVVMRLTCRVMVSGYWTSLYAEMLETWTHTTFQTTNRAGQLTEEHLWFNYPVPEELHDYRYLGRNFRERELINRKQARWLGRLKRMPLIERQAMMGALTSLQGATSVSAIADPARIGDATRSKTEPRRRPSAPKARK